LATRRLLKVMQGERKEENDQGGFQGRQDIGRRAEQERRIESAAAREPTGTDPSLCAASVINCTARICRRRQYSFRYRSVYALEVCKQTENIVQRVSKRDLQRYSKCYCVTKTFILTGLQAILNDG
jgi:hypothetical protein